MCTQTETLEECSRCGYVDAIESPILNCGLRSRQPFDSRQENYFVGRCYGVAITSYTDIVVCPTCATTEERERKRQESKESAQIVAK
ncbi:hypothetical protein NXS19_005628 [Fusarium pseudograminearum]|uniref:Uncharacterized protein n=1 Tax=Fusarium pseudograminearum (strain CS3096) TaxID=1028729 RepID=K3V7R9_FUSPC|nr:hypothetical protein FPSE_11991 [Fusarium pseudograminearum CS3096]EKJ67843.1 hypothetical protein FPSE_11991 [Fusarium pseudograminearum CS3096]UZP37812.1 hypothetical protein NXS19_005628 [Fusarium pseudograminearum]